MQTAATDAVRPLLELLETRQLFSTLTIWGAGGNPDVSYAGLGTLTQSGTPTASVPNRPFNLAVAAASTPGAVDVSFYDNSADETGFVVERAASAGGPFSVDATTGIQLGTGLVDVTDAQPFIAGTTYYYRVKATGATNDTAYEGPVTYTPTAPNLASPTNLAVSDRPDSANNGAFVDFTFTDPGGYSQFVVMSAVNGALANTVVNPAGAGHTITYSLPAFALQNYVFSVYGLTADGQQGPTAGPVKLFTGMGPSTPNGPYNLAVSATAPTSVQVLFVDNSLDETGFIVERSTSLSGPFTEVATAGSYVGKGGTVTVTDTTASAATTYFYRAYAVNSFRSSSIVGPSPVTTPMDSGGPVVGLNQVSSVTLARDPLGGADISFAGNSTTETGFIVRRATSQNGLYTQIAVVPTPGSGQTGQTVKYYDATATVAGTYYYEVSPSTSNATGPFSYPAAITVLPAPKNLQAAVVPAGSAGYVANVSFTDPGGYAQFVLHVLHNGGSASDITLASNGNAMLTTSFHVATGDTYTLSVYGITASTQTGDQSNAVTVFVPTFGTNPGGPPNGPYNLQLTASATHVQISFTNNADNATGFVVERATSSSGPFTEVDSFGLIAPVSANLVTGDDAVALGMTYYYRVYAVNGPYMSSIAGPIAVTIPASAGPRDTQNPGGVPNGPFNPMASALGHSAQIQFIDNSDNETGFILERATSPDGVWSQVTNLAPDTGVHQKVTYTDTPPTAGTYYYRAYAVNGQYQSSVTGPANVTTT